MMNSNYHRMLVKFLLCKKTKMPSVKNDPLYNSILAQVRSGTEGLAIRPPTKGSSFGTSFLALFEVPLESLKAEVDATWNIRNTDVQLLLDHVVDHGLDGLMPLMQERALMKDDKRNIVFFLTELLVMNDRTADNAIDGIVRMLQRNSTKQDRLFVALVTEHFIVGTELLTEAPVQRLLDGCLSGLVDCVIHDGSMDSYGGSIIVHTRLTLLCSMMALALIHSSIQTHSHSVLVEDLSWVYVPATDLKRLLKALATYKTDNPIKSRCLEYLQQLISVFIESQSESDCLCDVMKHICKCLVSHQSKSTQKMVKSFKKITKKHESSSQFVVKVVRVCCILSERPENDFKALINDADVQQILLTTASEAIRCFELPPIQGLGFQLLICSLQALQAADLEGNPHSIVSPFFELLKTQTVDSEAFSQGIAATIAVLGFKHKKHFIENILDLLGSSQEAVRKNGLFALEEVIRLHTSFFRQKQQLELCRFLADKLAICLLDNIHVRKHAISVFSHLHPMEVIPKLAARLSSASEKERSASEESLMMLLNENSLCSFAFFAFLEHVRAIEGASEYTDRNVVVTPGDIGRQKGPVKKSEQNDSIDRHFRVFSKYAESNIDSVVPFVRDVVKKIYSCPSDTLLMRLASTLSPLLVKPENGVAYLKTVLDILERQTCMSEAYFETLKDDSEVQACLFTRLSPVLMLKVVPSKTFASLFDKEAVVSLEDASVYQVEPNNADESNNWSSNDTLRLFVSLYQRASQRFEFEQVQEQACEVISHMPIHVVRPFSRQWFDATMDNIDKNSQGGVLGLDHILRVYANAIMTHGLSIQESHWLLEIMSDVMNVIAKLCDLTGQGAVLEDGSSSARTRCSQTIALILRLFSMHSVLMPSKKPSAVTLIEEIDADNKELHNDKKPSSDVQDAIMSLLYDSIHVVHSEKAKKNLQGILKWSNVIESTTTRCAMSTCVVNGIALAVQQQQRFSSPTSNEQQATRQEKAIEWLCKRFCSSLCYAFQTKHRLDVSMLPEMSILLDCAVLQSLFQFAYALKLNPQTLSVNDIIDVVNRTMCNASARVRLETLKVVGSILISVQSSANDGVCDPMRIVQLKSKLETRFESELDVECKSLLVKLRQLMVV